MGHSASKTRSVSTTPSSPQDSAPPVIQGASWASTDKSHGSGHKQVFQKKQNFFTDDQTTKAKDVKASPKIGNARSLNRTSSKVTPAENDNNSCSTNSCLSQEPQALVRESVPDGLITCVQLYNIFCDGLHEPYIFDPKYMLLIDTRTMDDYQAQHIITAKHASTLDNVFLVGALTEYHYVILYSVENHAGKLDDGLDKVCKQLTSQGLDVLILLGGYQKFQSQFSFLCTEKFIHSENDRKNQLIIYPSTILDNALYQGRGTQATNETVVTDLKISHILNISQEHANAFPGKVEYLSIKVDDETYSNLYEQFPKIIEFIGKAIQDGGRVLVHCNLGVSRSSAATISYLMHSRRCTLKDAYNLVKDQRPICKPNRGFLIQLSKFEQSLFGQIVSDVDDIWL